MRASEATRNDTAEPRAMPAPPGSGNMSISFLFLGCKEPDRAFGPATVGNHSHFAVKKIKPTARQAAAAQPRINQSSAPRGRLITEIPAMPIATTGPTIEKPKATSRIGPIPGMTRMSKPENRINMNKHHTAAQIARQQIDAVLRDNFAIYGYA
jgi:hypothetical protein